MKKNEKVDIIRSSTAEYLTFIASTGADASNIEMRYEDENIWLTQKMLATLYDVDVRTINEHIKNIFKDGELDEISTIRNFRIVQKEGNREVFREVMHYNLQMIIAVGFKVNSDRAVQFRKWVNKIAKDYTIKGWAMDTARLKSGGSILTEEYFDKLLQEIREIRLSERKFYQKITDIYATALDYDITASATKKFFSNVQNKLHWAIHRHTASELIMARANAEKPHMGLTSWEKAPHGKIQKFDVEIAKNYLLQEELYSLEKIVTMYLDYAEYQASRHMPMTMEDWAIRLNKFLEFNEHEILHNAGKVSAEVAKAFAHSEFEKYRIVQDKLFKSDFDSFLELEESAKPI
ncbi:MAG: virulence RhuM family protein [Bacillota bacterium]